MRVSLKIFFLCVALIIFPVFEFREVPLEDKFLTSAVIELDGRIIKLDDSVSRRLLDSNQSVANMTLQTPEEGDYLQFHRCFGKLEFSQFRVVTIIASILSDEGEAYAAAYLITKEHLLNHRIEHDLASANTELASFIVFDNSNNENNKKIRSGTITMALDVFDFSIIHLSAYERLVR